MPLPDESSLHKGLGVRRPDITDVRETPLAGLLHIGRHDERFVVLAKLLWQVGAAVKRVVHDPAHRRVMECSYNLPQDRDLNHLDLGGRLRLLEKRCPGVKGLRENTTNKLPSRYARRICAYWRSGEHKAAPADEIDRIAAEEQEYEEGGADDAWPVIPSISLEDMLRDQYSAWPERAERALLQSPVFFEVSDSGHAVTLRKDECERLLAFTTAEQFEGYAGPGRGFAEATGREVIERLAEFCDIGLAVNPTADLFFNLSPIDIARIRRQLQTEEA
ncbi:hypothetical protein SAMN04488564_12557 [Lentzea waywayandensis]|uniref:SseB protein N-terminal domain-containing protein n=1 Tax=Lentzea waywayandensis TaxID=84724 RepID=A0A1I6FJ97_9PSEU|nr:hypothetical protein [Lentzea waywayandensis]SFR30005.1 hypothetical protein SAMN04488564_12557 [Lentzea waywayandensis]